MRATQKYVKHGNFVCQKTKPCFVYCEGLKSEFVNLLFLCISSKVKQKTPKSAKNETTFQTTIWLSPIWHKVCKRFKKLQCSNLTKQNDVLRFNVSKGCWNPLWLWSPVCCVVVWVLCYFKFCKFFLCYKPQSTMTFKRVRTCLPRPHHWNVLRRRLRAYRRRRRLLVRQCRRSCVWRKYRGTACGLLCHSASQN